MLMEVLKSLRSHKYLQIFTKLLALKCMYVIFLTCIFFCVILFHLFIIVKIVMNGSYLLEYPVSWRFLASVASLKIYKYLLFP
jgi:hypothetical protein